MNASASRLSSKGGSKSVYIDVARLLAALLIVVFHTAVYYPEYRGLSALMVLLPPVPLFFLFAGYFSKQRTLLEVLKRAGILFSMLILWEFVAILISNREVPFIYLPLHTYTRIMNFLANYPLWFLRDLLIFTLCIPLCLRFKTYCMPIACVLLILSDLNIYSLSGKSGILSAKLLISFPYFLLGYSLQFISLDTIEKFFKRWWKVIVAFFAVTLACVQWLQPYGAPDYHRYPILALFVILFFCSVGMMIQELLPQTARFLQKLSSCSFLIFTCHVPLDLLLKRMFGYGLEGGDVAWISITVWPMATLALAAVLVASLRRWVPCLLPLVAGIKK